MKKLFGFVVVTCAVLTLFGLGTWQVQRLSWKQSIIDNLDAEYQKNPLEHGYDFEALKQLKEEETPIRFGSVNGNFLKTDSIFLQPKTHDGKVGAHVIHPFKLENGGHILVNIGWVDNNDIDLFQSLSVDNGEKPIIGIFRKPDWNRFTSDNSPTQNIWTKADINQIARYYKLENIAPVILYATEIKNNSDLILQDSKWYPHNKHRQYAIFWYGMIFVLLGLVALAVKSKEKSN